MREPIKPLRPSHGGYPDPWAHTDFTNWPHQRALINKIEELVTRVNELSAENIIEDDRMSDGGLRRLEAEARELVGRPWQLRKEG